MRLRRWPNLVTPKACRSGSVSDINTLPVMACARNVATTSSGMPAARASHEAT
eukprot:CAMPEP_0183577056 /NCGR_PEP_ID=MMETSP0371-20130417/139028_1 /TAXON_ID=268820 /ORGANISM="Peridinium aciculiferum, Strain PAER-2" /LENGTH=52 /DNA_ID=CAMNT_0025787351 /DNA_START=24 /DNA_END=178 /DNA_ORIENTATION=-